MNDRHGPGRKLGHAPLGGLIVAERSHNPLQNQLLASLPSAVLGRLQASLEVVSMPLGLEARSCECYAVVKREFDRLLPREH